MRKLLYLLSAVFLLLAAAAPPVLAAATDDMREAAAQVSQAIDRARQGDLAGARERYQQYSQTWFAKEDGVRETSRQAYKDIEEAMGEVQLELARNPADRDRIVGSLTRLHDRLIRFAEGGYPKDSPASGAQGKATVGTLLDMLREAHRNIQEGRTAEAAEWIEKVQSSWIDVEGTVLAKSPKVYTAMEQDMVTAKALLTKNPPEPAQALQVVERMEAALAPLANDQTYTFVDAAMVLLREGLEALLVIVALLAFLRKAGYPDKTKWVWSGVGAGVLISIALAVIVQLVFTSGTFGADNALVGGWTALFAAVMLLYVSYWLHSNANIAKWQQYIREKTHKALATGSFASLALLSFLAVFREGTETVLFYIGMAPSLGLKGLLLGLASGLGLLLIIGGLMFAVGIRIPVRPFFLISSVLVFYLCFKFVGVGINHLQSAGVVPATPASYLPSWDLLGLYPTWQTTIPQLALLIAAVAHLVWSRLRDQRLRRDAATEP